MFKNLQHNHIALFGILVAIAAFFLSRFVLSIGIGIIVFSALLNPALKDIVRKNYRNPVLVMFTLFFVIVLASGLYSENMEAFWAKVRIKIPFLLLPFGLLLAGPFTHKQFFTILYFFIFTTLAGVLWTTGNFLLHYEEITASYHMAKVMPTPIHHIRFSLMVVLAAASAAYLYWKRACLQFQWEAYVMLGIAIFFFAFLHLLAVRSGLLAIYLVIFFFTLYYVFNTKRYAFGMLIIIAMIAIPFAGYHMVPTIKSKVYYMRHDLQQYLQGNNQQAYSDARRLRSIEVAFKVGNLSPVIGVGYGDIHDVSDKMYDLYYPDTPKNIRVFAHNQFAYLYAAMGFVGLTYFTVMIFLPLFYRKGYSNFLIATVSIIAISSFMTEHTLETQYGTAFYLLFLCIGLQIHYNPPTDG